MEAIEATKSLELTKKVISVIKNDPLHGAGESFALLRPKYDQIASAKCRKVELYREMGMKKISNIAFKGETTPDDQTFLL